MLCLSYIININKHCFKRLIVKTHLPIKSRIIVFLIFIGLSSLHSQQDTLSIPSSFKDKSLSLGYAYSGIGDGSKDYHLLEIEYWNTAYSTYRMYFGICKYYGIDIGLNTADFIVSPKAGVTLNYGVFIFGAESVLYTDFNEASLRIAPVKKPPLIYFGPLIQMIQLHPNLKT